MKLKIICIVVFLVGMHLLASSNNNCTSVCQQQLMVKKEVPHFKSSEKKMIENTDEELLQFSLLPFHTLLFNL
jgi:hypothetical protein